MTGLNSGFQPWNSGHDDIILSTAWDYCGRRLATASADQTIRIWEKRKDGRKSGPDRLQLVDHWQAHNGEVTRVRFVSPYSSHICSLSTDCSLRIWAEDVLAPYESGRRYLCIFQLRSETRLPFSSVDFKTGPAGLGGLSSSSLATPDPLAPDPTGDGSRFANGEQYMSVTTQDGLLLVFQAGEPTDVTCPPLSVWSEVFRTYLQYHHRRFLTQANGRLAASTPGAGTAEATTTCTHTLAAESSFLAVFDPSPLPAYTAIGAGLPRHSLGLAVVAMNSVYIFRTDNAKKYYLAARLDSGGAPGSSRADILRDVAWAPGNVRGYDLISAAGKGGWVWVWSLKAEPLQECSLSGDDGGDDDSSDDDRNDDESIDQQLPPKPDQADDCLVLGSLKLSDETETNDSDEITADDCGEIRADDTDEIKDGGSTDSELTESTDEADDIDDDDDDGIDMYDSIHMLTSTENRLAGRIRHLGELIAELKHPSSTWTCEWNLLGDVLITTSDDAIVRTWKQAIDGEWLECGSVET